MGIKRNLIIGVTFFAIAGLSISSLKLIGFEKEIKRHPLEPVLSLEVNERPVLYNPSRIGLNLEKWTSSGTGQYAKNILLNPGFEGSVERLIVIVSQATSQSFSDEAGLGYPDNYWSNARFDIRTGAQTGKSGIITRSLNSGENGYPQYYLDKPYSQIRENDVIVLTKVAEGEPVDFWKSDKPALIRPDFHEKAPHSSGNQSLLLKAIKTAPAHLYFYADTSSNKSGNKMLIDGSWRLSFWAKAEQSLTPFEVSFQREGAESFFNEKLSLTSEWKEYQIDFSGREPLLPGRLKLAMTALKPGAPVWLDDISLEPLKGEEGVFRKDLVEVLKTCRLSYLREFAYLSDIWENRLADEFARKSMKYQTVGGKQQIVYGYSLHDFLQLCSEVKANPWLIIPATYSDEECRLFGQFLARYADKERFAHVILEFGANNWNWLYRQVAIPYMAVYGEVAGRAFNIIHKETEKKTNIHFFVNGQLSSPDRAIKFIEHTKLADGLAVTTDFFPHLNRATPDKQVLQQLFKEDKTSLHHLPDELFAKGKGFAISEINLSVAKGDAGVYEKNRVVSGAISGSALAKKLLDCLYKGADPILVNGLGEVSSFSSNDYDDSDQLGIIQKLGSSTRFKPTGLALIMLNQVIEGNMHPITFKETKDFKKEKLTMASFKTTDSWKSAIVSANDKPLLLEIRFPDDGNKLPTKIVTLESSEPFQTNEEEERVKIVEQTVESHDRVIKLTVPAWGFVTLN